MFVYFDVGNKVPREFPIRAKEIIYAGFAYVILDFSGQITCFVAAQVAKKKQRNKIDEGS